MKLFTLGIRMAPVVPPQSLTPQSCTGCLLFPVSWDLTFPDKMAPRWCNPYTPPVSPLFAQQSSPCQRPTTTIHCHGIFWEAPCRHPPTPLFLFSPLFFLLLFISIVTVLSHARAFLLAGLPHSPPVKLPGGFPGCHSLAGQGGAAVGPAGPSEMFIWSWELTGLTAHPHRAFVMWFKTPCRLSQAPLYSPHTNQGMGLAFHFSANLHAIAQTKASRPPSYCSQADFPNRFGRLTPVAPGFWTLFAGCLLLARVFLLFHN